MQQKPQSSVIGNGDTNMTRKYNTTHPDRSISGYHWNKKTRGDRYGTFDNGQQMTPDYIAGKKVFYRDKIQEHETEKRTGKWPVAPKRVKWEAA
jgi:hypothetical protein